jgi:hypothetical protein
VQALAGLKNAMGIFSAPPRLDLPAAFPCSSTIAGAHAAVSDATIPTFLETLTGGGAVTAPVFYNGTAWVSG